MLAQFSESKAVMFTVSKLPLPQLRKRKLNPHESIKHTSNSKRNDYVTETYWIKVHGQTYFRKISCSRYIRSSHRLRGPPCPLSDLGTTITFRRSRRIRNFYLIESIAKSARTEKVIDHDFAIVDNSRSGGLAPALDTWSIVGRVALAGANAFKRILGGDHG